MLRYCVTTNGRTQVVFLPREASTAPICTRSPNRPQVDRGHLLQCVRRNWGDPGRRPRSGDRCDHLSVITLFHGLGCKLFDCLVCVGIGVPTRLRLPSCSQPSRTLRAAGAVARRRAILDCRCARRHMRRAGRDGRMVPIEQKDGTAAAVGRCRDVRYAGHAARRDILMDFPLPLPPRCRESRKWKRAAAAMSCCRLRLCSRLDWGAGAVSNRRDNSLGRTCRGGRRR